MSDKTKNNLRKIVYFVLFAIMICCFIYLGEKYADNSQEKILTINDYYNDLDKISPVDSPCFRLRSNSNLSRVLKGLRSSQ